jgi:transposase
MASGGAVTVNMVPRRPTKWAKRDIVNAIFFVAATGCQWRALPDCYPYWNTVHRYHAVSIR